MNMGFNSLPKLEQQEIIEVLNQFGLNEKDREVYFALLKQDQTTITPLARMVRYPVTTVQSILHRLDQKGLVNVTTRKSRHVYEANDPAVFKKILERQIQDINNVIPLIKKLKTVDETGTKIRIFYRERMTDIFHEALKSREGLVYEIVSAKDLQEVLVMK